MVEKQLHPEDLHFMPAGNRTIKPSVTAKLKKSISSYGILRSVVVVRTNIFGEGLNYYIADGQHLYLACEALNVLSQLNIIIVKKRFNNIQELVEFVSVLNTTQSPWKLTDYIEAFASTHTYFSYNKLKAKKQKFSLSYGLLAMIYGQLSKKAAADAIKSGTFRVVNEQQGDDITKYIVDLVDLFGRSNSTALSNLAHVFHEHYNASEYDHKMFKKFVERNLQDFNTATVARMHVLLKIYQRNRM